MKIENTIDKKILAGATAVVALSGFVPAINAASPTATANVGVSVVIQQAITINVGANVDLGTIVLSAATVAGTLYVNTLGVIGTSDLTGEVSHVGGHAIGTMAINQSAGAVNIAVGASPTDNGGNIVHEGIKFGGTALALGVWVNANANASVNLIGSTLDLGSWLTIVAKPTPGTYNTKSFAVTVTDI